MEGGEGGQGGSKREEEEKWVASRMRRVLCAYDKVKAGRAQSASLHCKHRTSGVAALTQSAFLNSLSRKRPMCLALMPLSTPISCSAANISWRLRWLSSFWSWLRKMMAAFSAAPPAAREALTRSGVLPTCKPHVQEAQAHRTARHRARM